MIRAVRATRRPGTPVVVVQPVPLSVAKEKTLRQNELKERTPSSARLISNSERERHTQRLRDRESERETERESKRASERERERETHTHTETERHRAREKQRERDSHTHTHTHRARERDKDRQGEREREREINSDSSAVLPHEAFVFHACGITPIRMVFLSEIKVRERRSSTASQQ